MRIDLLDMGRTRFGDCVLVRSGTRSILIDGAHPGDTASIRSQLRALLDHEPPFRVDLLVVTHCHNDHIGCLPSLISRGDLTAGTALVADEKLGWGRDADGASPVDALELSAAQRALVAALQEEDRSDLPEAELEQFLLEDATLEEKYGEMLQQLAEQGTRVVRYGRAPSSAIRGIEEEFADFGLRVIGPTRDHLVLCAQAIASGSDAIAALVAQEPASDASPTSLAAAYRRLARGSADPAFGSDQGGPSAAKNDQSIVLKVRAGGWSALLAGDMQFADPEVPGLDSPMETLRQAVVDAGPYDFIKLTHHTSHNAVDASVLDEWESTRLFAHTGGSNDPGHPEEGALELLESRKSQLKFARTDRNGIVTVKKNGSVRMSVSRGKLNDFSVNQVQDEPEPPELQESPRQGQRGAEPAAPSAVFTRTGDGDSVEVYARVPHRSTKVTLTIQVEPGEVESEHGTRPGPERTASTPGAEVLPGPPPGPAPDPRGDRGAREGRVGAGRRLPKLLFATCRPRLEANIGQAETARVFALLESSPSIRVLDLPPGLSSAEDAAQHVRAGLARGDFSGVVLLGGYDVVPAHRLDVLDEELRVALEAAGLDSQDADGFIVWSDDLYGDRDGDFLPELPVSRIPDGRRADVVFAALQARGFTPSRRFGVTNLHRPFATRVFPGLPGQGGRLEVSEQFAPEDVPAGAAAGAVYYMLHGSARDATRFWGETRGGAAYEAVAVENVPGDAAGTAVFTGCCWGALAMSPPAARIRPGTPLRPRSPEDSIAIAYLRAGALAFVGCTGSHYSPLQPPYDYFGKPMHDAFWSAVGEGMAPAEALFQAKKVFVAGMPHGRTDPFSRAVETKILRQFTCLGLGW